MQSTWVGIDSNRYMPAIATHYSRYWESSEQGRQNSCLFGVYNLVGETLNTQIKNNVKRY